jgi:hypothetical protein
LKVTVEVQVAGVKPDVFIVFFTSYGTKIPIGVVEVKRPIDDITTANKNLDGQVYSQMQILHSFLGLQCCLGIVTNYKLWVVCFLNSSEAVRDVVAAGNMESLTHAVKKLETASVNEATWDDKFKTNVLAVDKAVAYDSSQFPQFLTSVLFKMYSCRQVFNSRTKPFDSRRGYIFVSSTDFVFRSCPKALTEVKVKRVSGPHGYYLFDAFSTIESSHRVFKAFDGSGLRCVVKFFSLNEEEDRNSEHGRWQQLGLGAKSEMLAGVPALILPLLDPLPDTMKSAEDDGVQDCLRRFASAGLKHTDLRWRHVGMLNNRVELLDLGLCDCFTETCGDRRQWEEEAISSMTEALRRL